MQRHEQQWQGPAQQQTGGHTGYPSPQAHGGQPAMAGGPQTGQHAHHQPGMTAGMQQPMPGQQQMMPGMQPGMMPGQQQMMPGMQQPGMMPGQQMMPGMQPGMMPGQQQLPAFPQIPGMLPLEQSYIENILRLNRGKPVTVYMTFEQNPDWGSMVFEGIVEEAGRDHIVLSNPETGQWYLLLMVYLDYIVFEEEIEYDYPFNDIPPLAGYAPR
ncbi:spore coat protein GerQ [Bacillus sp. FJAT-44742]|uniref:spore coat protein GerQ n=1 Tax=Bacillus sp. FJAT-44742 TaxID=2014005 RepID=UPI001E601BF3|nr:spore coat protein GerQ [Bacillus sp. FJAT-44742]